MKKTIKKLNEEFDRVFQDDNEAFLENQNSKNGSFQKKVLFNTRIKCLTFSICTSVLLCLITATTASIFVIKCSQDDYPIVQSLTEKSMEHGKKYFEENVIADLTFNCSILLSSKMYVLNTYLNESNYIYQIYTHQKNNYIIRMNGQLIDFFNYKNFSYFWNCEKGSQKEFHIEILQENNLLDEVTVSFK